MTVSPTARHKIVRQLVQKLTDETEFFGQVLAHHLIAKMDAEGVKAVDCVVVGHAHFGVRPRTDPEKAAEYRTLFGPSVQVEAAHKTGILLEGKRQKLRTALMPKDVHLKFGCCLYSKLRWRKFVAWFSDCGRTCYREGTGLACCDNQFGYFQIGKQVTQRDSN